MILVFGYQRPGLSRYLSRNSRTETAPTVGTPTLDGSSAFYDREPRGQLLSPLTLFDRLGNGDAAGATDSLYRLFRTGPGGHQDAGSDQAGSANTLAAMHGNVLSRLQLSPNARNQRDRFWPGGGRVPVNNGDRNESDGVTLGSLTLVKKVQLNYFITVEQ